jgi:hypothetical protein
MSTRKRTTRKTGSQKKKSVTRIVEVRVVENGKEIIPKQRLAQGHWQPEADAASKKPNAGTSGTEASALSESGTVRQAVQKQLQSPHSRCEAWECFQKLVSDGCDENFLYDALATIRFTRMSELQGKFKELFGCDRRSFLATLERIDKRSSGRSAKPSLVEFIDRLPAEYRQSISSHRGCPPVDLPGALRTLVDRLKEVACETRERGRPHYDRALAAIVHHVRERMGAPRHVDIANIVEAMRGDDYSVEAHKVWVSSHQALVSAPWR